MAFVFNLLTDFGLNDPYVGQMKAVLRSSVPDCHIIDLCHTVRPQNIQQAAFFLKSSFDYLPAGSLTLAVIDPGVGTNRRILLLEMRNKWLLVPDNGLVSLLVKHFDPGSCLEIPLENYSRSLNSATFHGRDIFCPLAIKWSYSINPGLLGQAFPVSKLKHLSMPEAQLSSDQVQASVLHIDNFGNCILNMSIEYFWKKIKDHAQIKINHSIEHYVYPVRTYANIPESQVGILPGSQGYLELAMNRACCAKYLNLDLGHHLSFVLSP